MEAVHEESRYSLYRCHLLRECHALPYRCKTAMGMYRKGVSNDVWGKPTQVMTTAHSAVMRILWRRLYRKAKSGKHQPLSVWSGKNLPGYAPLQWKDPLEHRRSITDSKGLTVELRKRKSWWSSLASIRLIRCNWQGELQRQNSARQPKQISVKHYPSCKG